MAGVASEYPKRPAFFAHRFTRLMGKVCLGADIGPEACWLLAFIVATEDAAGYRRPVSFFNEDLATRTGMSISGMRRARDRAVSAGWLVHIDGAKGRAARYYVAVPKWAMGLDDSAGDERDGEMVTDHIPRQIDAASGEHVAGIRQESGRNPAGIRQESEQHSSLALAQEEEDPREDSCTEPPKPAAPVLPVEPAILTIPCSGTGPKEWPLTASKLTEWQAAFPAVDVPAEVRKARQWVIDNPSRRKTYRGVPKFLGGWLSRAQDRGGTGPPVRAAPGPPITNTIADKVAAQRAAWDAREAAKRTQQCPTTTSPSGSNTTAPRPETPTPTAFSGQT